ncbi:MFS transporter [Planococcus lenghuensis]|uniref:MFS transporter n=1 Tax=Planococcus lenghuensis TaxID=2213202 RepID=A0A1Q2KV75_9BACL|nr:MFS transporter [Planococcus lenghuensis]AQQ52110.1 MFS transporter [Planococcus lenghuensis]
MRFFIYVIIFFAFFDLFAQLPVISPFAGTLGASPFLTGLAVGIYSFANTGGNMVSGILADRRGPYTVLLIGLFTTGIALFLYQFAASPSGLLLIRFIHGMAAGLIIPAAFTYAANKTGTQARGRNGAVAGAFIGLAAIIGPAFSAVTAAATNVPFVMSITGTALLIIAVAAAFLLKRLPGAAQKNTNSEGDTAARAVFSSGLVLSYTGAFFLMFSQGVLAYMLPLRAIALGFGTETGGLLLSVFGLAAIAVFALPVNRVFDMVPPVYTMTGGLAIMGGSLFVLSGAETLPFLYSSMASYGVGFAFLFPSINSLLIDSTTAASRGKAYGLFYACFSIGVVAGSGITGALELTAGSGFILSGSLLLALALSGFLFKNRVALPE